MMLCTDVLSSSFSLSSFSWLVSVVRLRFVKIWPGKKLQKRPKVDQKHAQDRQRRVVVGEGDEYMRLAMGFVIIRCFVHDLGSF